MQGKKAENTVTIKQTPDTKKKKSSGNGRLSVTALLMKMSEDTGFMKESLENIMFSGETTNQLLISTNNLLQEFLNTSTSKIKAKPVNNKVSVGPDIDGHLSNIEDLLSKIVKSQTKLSKAKAEKTEVDTSNIDSIANSIQKLNDSISKKTNKNIRQFIHLLKQLGAEAYNVESVVKSFGPLANSLGNISDAANRVASSIKNAMKGIMLFAIFLQSPLFTKATQTLTNFFDAIQKKKTKTKTVTKNIAIDYKYLFLSLALGITAIAASLILLKNVDWKQALMLVAFIFSIAGAMWLMTKNNKGINITKTKNISNSNNKGGLATSMVAFAFALGIVVLGIYALKEIDWKQALTLVLFIAALAAIFVGSKLLIGKRNSPDAGMLGFAFGMGVLVLAIEAGKLVFFGYDGKNWQIGPWAIAGFVMAMAFVLGKGKGGGGARDMLRFAGGIAVLVLTIWAWDKLISSNPDMLKHVWSLALIAGIFVLIYRIAKGDLTVMFGKGKLGQTRKAAQKGGMNKQTLIEFAACIAIIVAAGAGAMWVLSKIDARSGDLIARALVMLGVLAVIGYGIPEINKHMNKIKNKSRVYINLGIISAVAIIGSIVINILGATDVNSTDLVTRAGVMLGTLAIIAAGIVILGKFDKKTIISGGIAMAVLVGIMYIATQAIKTLIETKTEGNLMEKATVMWVTIGIIAAGVLALGSIMLFPPMILAIAMGGAAMLAISGIMLVASKAFLIIGKAEIKKEKIDIFLDSMLTTVKSFTSLSLRQIVKGSAAGVAMFPLFASAKKLAETLKIIGDIKVSQEDITRFTDTMIGFIKSFTESINGETIGNGLKEVAKGEEGILSMIKAATGFVDVLLAIANGKIAEYEVKDGQAVLTGYKPFSLDQIGTQAGAQIGRVVINFINSLKDLELSKSQRKTLNRLGEIFTGEDGQGGLNTVFDSIINLVNNTDGIATLKDANAMTSIGNNLSMFVRTIVNDFSSNMAEIDKFSKGSVMNKNPLELFATFIKEASNAKWESISSGAEKSSKSVNKLVSSINKLDIKKAVELRNTLKAFSDIQKLKKVEGILQKLLELVEKINSSQAVLENLSKESQNKLEKTEDQIKQTKEAIKNASGSAISSEFYAKYVIPIIQGITDAINEKDGMSVKVANKIKLDEASIIALK